MSEQSPAKLEQSRKHVGRKVRVVRIDGQERVGILAWWGPKSIGVQIDGTGAGREWLSDEVTVFALDEATTEPAPAEETAPAEPAPVVEAEPEPQPEPVTAKSPTRRKAASA
jgi:hypothetical protein